jgi:hypothetical protein
VIATQTLIAARYTDNSNELARVTIKMLDFKITVLD